MLKLTLLVIATVALSSCASIPTEYTSPCACNYKPLDKNSDERVLT